MEHYRENEVNDINEVNEFAIYQPNIMQAKVLLVRQVEKIKHNCITDAHIVLELANV